jgi:hypothetical protein
LDDLVSAAVRWAAALIYFAPSSLNHIIAGLARPIALIASPSTLM